MASISKPISVAIIAVSLAVALLIALVWAGPGATGGTSPPTVSALFDEELVQDVYDRVSPAVVEVTIDSRFGSLGQLFTQAGSGSGFLIDREGHIATNSHVIEGADRVRITLSDGTAAEAEVLGRDPANDLALLKVNPGIVEGIEPVELGNSSLVRPGQLAIAIGSPFGLEGSITAGVISGVDRDLPSSLGRSITGVLQTDALINPGNSGGPLLNKDGQAVGINTAISTSPTLINGRSIGFAVPINTLVDLLPRLQEKQVLQPPWLGIRAATLEPLLVERLELPVGQGVYVTGVEPGSPAAQAGLVPAGTEFLLQPTAGGDIIVAVDGTAVNSVPDLISELNRHRPGDEIALTVVRDGSEAEVQVTLGEWPTTLSQRLPSPIFPRQKPGEPRIPGQPQRPSIPRLPFPDLFPDSPHR